MHCVGTPLSCCSFFYKNWKLYLPFLWSFIQLIQYNSGEFLCNNFCYLQTCQWQKQFLLPLQIMTSLQRWFSPEFWRSYLSVTSYRKLGCQAAHVARGTLRLTHLGSSFGDPFLTEKCLSQVTSLYGSSIPEI